MLRGSKSPLKVKDNESGCPDLKEEASLPLPREQKSCRVTKSRITRPSKKENVTDGSHTGPPKRALKWPKGPEGDLCHPQGADVGWQLPGVLRDTKGEFSSAPLGNDFCTPERDRVEGKADSGGCEQPKSPVDFAAVLSAEFGVAQESSAKRATGTSPGSLKFRRRSTIGLRGSPEKNTLIRYLAQQRSSRQREPFTQISPFTPENVRSLKDKIDAFQASFESLQEAEGESSQEGGSSQNRTPLKKEPNLEQWSEKFVLGNRGAALKGNLNENGRRICSILSPHRAGTAPYPAKGWVCEQQNAVKCLESVPGDSLETGHGSVPQLCACSAVPRCEHSDPALEFGSQTPGTALGSTPSSEPCHSSSLLRSILKKTPRKELRDSPKESSSSATDRGGAESAVVSSCVKSFETLQTDTAATPSSKTPRKKKVTFGQVLSPEIFDQSLPANTPLRRGASPGCPQSPWARPGLPQEPLPLLDLGFLDEEGVEPLPELLEASVAAEPPPPVENAQAAETAKPDMVTTRSSTKRKQGPGELQQLQVPPQVPQQGPSSASDPQNPPRRQSQRQRKPSTGAAKRSQKSKYPSYGRRRKKKAKKSLYGEREMASKKPLLSPIPEIPEVFSALSSPSSPEAHSLGPEDLGDPRLLQEAAAPSSGLSGSLEPAPATAAQFSNPVPDAAGDADPPEHFQRAEHTPREKTTKESSSLLGKEELQGNLPGLELLEPQEGTQSPRKDSAPAKRRRRRSSSAFSLPPVEGTPPGAAVCCYSLEEALAVPQGRAELRVRRSMRLSKAAATEGLAWVQLPSEQLPALPKGRRSSSISILAGAENLQPRQPNLLPVAAPGKENEGSAPPPPPPPPPPPAPPPAAAPGSRCRRSLLETPGTLWAPTQRRRSTRSGWGKDSRGQNHSEAAETLQPRLKGVAGISDFLK